MYYTTRTKPSSSKFFFNVLILLLSSFSVSSITMFSQTAGRYPTSRQLVLISLLVVLLLISDDDVIRPSHGLNNLVFGGGGGGGNTQSKRNPIPSPFSNNNKIGQVGRVTAGPIEISSLGCGTWSWGNRLLFDYDPSQDDEIYLAYKEIRNAGVTIFDTADSYGTLDLNGRAELLLGKFERKYQEEKTAMTRQQQQQEWWDISSSFSKSSSNDDDRNQQQVATKLAPYPWRVTSGQIVQAAEGSLRRLQQPKLAVAQLHWSTANYQPFQERALWEGICSVYDKGLCESVGVSNYGPVQLQKVSQFFNNNEVPLSVAQIQYSLMTYKDAKPMNDACDEVGCRLISYSPLCLGLLTGKYNLDTLPQSQARKQLFRELLPGAKTLLNTLEVIAKDYGKSQSQVAINWAICKGTVPIPGARTVQQARENVGATGWSLQQDAIDALDKAALNVGKPMIQNIFQTK
jgi:pyridoxine 4-dehydrogenase